MWCHFLILLVAVSTAGATCHQKREPAGKRGSIFADLTADEMQAVRDFLMSKPRLRLSSARRETLKKNSIFLMELHVPKKGDALKTLDQGRTSPKREARVVVTFGDQLRPNITEYIVGPLPKPTYYKHTTFAGKTPKFESRPTSQTEYYHITNKLQEITKKVYRILVETSGFSFHNCTDRCLTFSDVAPRGLESGERRAWFVLQKFVEGYFIHPIGFELLLNHKSLDPTEWEVEKVWYNDQYFDSVEELVEKYEKGEVTKMTLPDHDDDDLYSTYIPRGESSTRANVQGPKLVQPQGPRYRVEGNFVEYAGWSFAFRVRSSAGLQLFDLRFNGERVAYEISLQEAVAFYSGSTPAAMQTKYIDGGWGMGTEAYELASGIDCPDIATFVDLYHYYDTDRPVRYKNALCIFEMTTGVPLRRHFNSNFKGGYNFYGGLENNVLVIRTTSTVYNYDYIWDFLFYQNGVVEAKVSATGYIHTTFFTSEGLNHGARVHSYVLGNLHTHLVNYKVDLDIAGRDNSFETIELKYENFTNPWSPRHSIVQSRLHRTQRTTEREAAFPFGKRLPRYLHFYNPTKKNRWGHHRGYRIQFNSHADSVLPRSWKEEVGITWSRYPLAVTCQKDSEVMSSTIYTQNDPWEPVVSFEDYISNNENIDKTDLVAWVTVGFLHIPHSEDIPNTSTPGNSVGFFLRPFNFFNEDPSVASRDTVIVRPHKDSFSKVDTDRWTPELAGYCMSNKPFHYNGTYEEV
ncbi:amiloride-sensitive amine oxidase [copper-containing]-like [Polyodon spathula]|uniref:amiloride-sensitive amine oxidase [copper-containing]-like n=1 Tax=Polyodon spathula TaxID=7913 RepID=UPI001B7EE5F3|nr:amiloride-sensitive amine oxidase [copper-containing]-like [Polyodon spathula]